MCTEIGCSSGVTVELSEVDLLDGHVFEVRLCLDGACTTETITVGEPAEVGVSTAEGEADLGRAQVFADPASDTLHFSV